MTRTQVLQEEIRWMRFEEACGGWQSRRRHRRRFVCWRGKRTFRFDRLAEEVEPNEPRLLPAISTTAPKASAATSNPWASSSPSTTAG